ncbi:MAG: enoyl-CoA hydratase/isomerase family protein [Chloroflexi bacterium]|nr:enoyl-CoA hydratase/isomerase family protein [Chloroflexota bacterium]
MTTAGGVQAHAERLASLLAGGRAVLDALPRKPLRSASEAADAATIIEAARSARAAFLRQYVEDVYRSLTSGYTRFLRADELVYTAAEWFPGLTPSRAEVAAERERLQKDKDGVEVDQGLFLSAVLSHPRAGLHLLHAMLRPRDESLERLEHFVRTGRADIGSTVVQREGRAGYVFHANPGYLNAEDDSTTDSLEIATDLVILDPSIEVGVLRGAEVDHPKYQGRRVFNAGINLTQIYHGQLSYLFYLNRDLGYVNKLYRGVSGPEFNAGEIEATLETPWIAAVESFAIGGGCQLLLVMDRVLAERGSYFSLPARKEGIIPGAANLRLPRFVGDRLTRSAILFDEQFAADSPNGRLLCDEVVAPGEMDAALHRAVESLTGSGVVSASGNRKAIRVGQEPIDVFRQYMAVYAREQASCHFSPQLIDNLERHWNAHQRTVKERSSTP